MKSNLKLGLVLLLGVMVFIALIETSKKESIDWRKSFNSDDKIPYGTYVLKNELKSMLSTSPELITAGESLYTFLEDNEYDSTATVLFIGSNFSVGKAANKKLLDFVENGGSAFLAATKFDLDIIKRLQVGHQEFNEYEAQVDFKQENVLLFLSRYKQNTVAFDRLKQFAVFNKMNKETTIILGYAKKGGVAVPNFIKVKHGKGAVFLHLEPEVFTNYYMLQKETFSFVYHSLEYLKGQQIIWYDGYAHTEVKEETTPLRFILRDRVLSSVWYLLLLALLLYLIFKSKREQRAVPIVEPESNLTIAFAKTIGSLYYENGVPGNMVLKKIEYFLFEIRKHYYLDTSDLMDKRFIEALSQRTAIPKGEVELFLTQIQHIQNQTDFSTGDLKITYQLIEEFKQKARLI